ncbi:MAG: 16S rRNA (guanine(966)-N(2))-methyltransferase RsmD, partial [bacterium]|nr:16S rRNA (guanine(966)-N(2))-methyltransferase RsmD [bacterium]
MLKIFTGLYKGRKLKSVKHESVRPTTAKVKLSFFDIMQDNIRETIFLDGFGGVGNIGIEALSRGAEYVVFIEQLGEVVKVLQHNLDKIGIPADHYRIIKGDYNRSVIQLANEGYKFDIVFLDPPYELLTYANPLKVVYKRDILKDDGIIVLERPGYLKFEGKYFDCYRTQKIGRKSLDFFCH